MSEAILIIVGLIVGGVAGAYIGLLRGRREAETEKTAATSELAGVRATLDEVRTQLTSKEAEVVSTRKAGEEAVTEVRSSLEAELNAIRATLETERVAGAKINQQLESSREHFAEQRRQIEEMEKKVKDSFQALSATALTSNNEQFVTLAEAKMKPLREQLERYEAQIKSLEKARQEAYGGLGEKLTSLEERERQLSKETRALVAALRHSGAKGKWGEATLQRIVEISGLAEYCDFDTQVTLENGLRPDLVVRMPGGRNLVVDSKVNTGAYLDAVDATDDERREQYLKKYMGEVHSTMKTLGGKEYWKALSPSPEFVVMFMPGEAFFATAISRDHRLLENGLNSGVLVASPTTLLALLLAVRHGWQQQQVAENAKKIAEAGHELYDRLCTFVGHLDRVRDGIDKAAKAYNDVVGSWERRALPGVKRLKELHVADPAKKLPELHEADVKMRQIAPPDEP